MRIGARGGVFGESGNVSDSGAEARRSGAAGDGQGRGWRRGVFRGFGPVVWTLPRPLLFLRMLGGCGHWDHDGEVICISCGVMFIIHLLMARSSRVHSAGGRPTYKDRNNDQHFGIRQQFRLFEVSGCVLYS